MIADSRFRAAVSVFVVVWLVGWGTTEPASAELARVSVTLAPVASGPEAQEPTAATIVAEAISVRGATKARDIRFDGIEVPGTSTLALDDEYVWRLRLEGEGVWAPPQIVGLDEGSARFSVWPTGRLSGSVRVAEGEDVPEVLEIRFESTADGSSEPGSALAEPATVECPLEDRRFSCEVPAARLDLRLRARRFVSLYRWDVSVRRSEPVDLGTLRLRAGASVVGSVVAEGGSLDRGETSITLAPEASAPVMSEGADRRRRSTGLVVRPDERGFFHFAGVSPGAYRLTVSHPGFATTELHPVSVLPRSETAIRDPLVLRRPVELELFVEPPADAFDRPWRVELARSGPIPGALDSLGERAVDPAGSLSWSGLDPGDYVLSVFDSQDARFAWEEIELVRERGPIFLSLDLVWVEGLVSLGDDPVEGELTFGGRNGTRKIAMPSDGDGVFGGFLPEEGEWEVYVEAPDVRRTVTVEVDRGEDRTAEVRIELPDTRIAGRVVDDRRDAVEGAMVKAAEVEGGRVVWRRSDAEGEFLFRGLDEGAVALEATLGRELSSASRVLQVSEDRETGEQELVLRRRARVEGRVVSSTGPVPGALVVVIPKTGGVEDPFALRPQAVTDPAGAFSVAVPDDADRLEVVLFPPGFALTARVIRGVPEEPVELLVAEHGGDLVLDLGGGETEAEGGAPGFPVVRVDGVTLDASLLRRWAALKLADTRDTDRLEVPNVAPGDYTACWTTYRELVTGSSAPDCVDGFLPPYGDLALSLAAPRDGS